MPPADIALYTSTGAAVISAAYAVIPFHWPRSAQNKPLAVVSRTNPKTSILVGLVGVAWLAVVVGYLDRHGGEGDLIQGWGTTNDRLIWMVVQGKTLDSYKHANRTMMINRIMHSNVDRMTDTRIVKSDPFTITDGLFTIGHVGYEGLSASLGVPSTMEFDLVLLPNGFAPSQVESLADVERFGGKILDAKAAGITFVDPLAFLRDAHGECPPGILLPALPTGRHQ